MFFFCFWLIYIFKDVKLPVTWFMSNKTWYLNDYHHSHIQNKFYFRFCFAVSNETTFIQEKVNE